MRQRSATERLLGAIVARDPFADAMLGDLLEQHRREVGRLGRTTARVRHARRILGILLHFAAARLRGTMGSPPRGTAHRVGRVGSEGPFVALLYDIRRALRALRHRPASTGIAVTTMALAIGTACVVFSIADHVLLRALPYPAAERLAYVWSENPRSGSGGPDMRPEALPLLRARTEVFDRVEARDTQSRLVTGLGEPADLEVTLVTPGLLRMLGAEPVLGRGFTDEQAGERVAVASHALWTERLGADGSVLGREILLDDVPYTVIGVLPDWFRYPSNDTVAWIPMPTDTERPRVTPVVRLIADVTVPVVDAHLAAASAALREADLLHEGWELNLWSLQAQREFFAGSANSTLWILLEAVVFVVAIASVNLANLRLTDFLDRTREVAIASALGARRHRLLRQMLLESVVTATVGGLLGAVLANTVLELIVRSAPASLGFVLRGQSVEVDGRILGVVLTVSLLSGTVAGLIPALRASRGATAGALVSAGQSTTQSGGQRRIRAGLVVAEVALATSLLLGSGLLIKGFLSMSGMDPGFEIDGIVVTEVTVGDARYPAPAAKLDLLERLQASLAALPGVDASAVADGAPPRTQRRRFLRFSGVEGSEATAVEGAGYGPGEGRFVSVIRGTDGYLPVLGLTPVAGRAFGPDDSGESVIVNETLAGELWPRGDAVGGRVSLGSGEPLVTVVGVVPDIRHSGFDETAQQMELYRPLLPVGGGRVFQLLLRTTRRDAGLAREVRATIRTLDRELPIGQIATMRARYGEDLALQRFSLAVMSSLAAVGTLLAALGLYGVISYDVHSSSREIGIRIALGATPRRVFQSVVGRGLGLAAAGVVAGGTASFWLARLMESMLFGVDSRDAGVFAAIAVGALAVAAAASSLPALRATRVDIVENLRQD